MNRSKERKRRILSRLEEYLAPYYSPAYEKREGHGGHDVTHCQRMCKIAEKLWPAFKKIPGIKEAIKSGEITLFLLKVSIWFHNLDHTTEFADHSEEFYIREILRPYPEIQEKEIQAIINAVSRHSFREQQLNDHPLSCVLRYCDMLDFGAIGILRIGAYRHTPYITSDFTASQTLPGESADKLPSALAAVSRVIEWWTEEGFLPLEIKALDWVRENFEFMILFRTRCMKELKELGIA